VRGFDDIFVHHAVLDDLDGAARRNALIWLVGVAGIGKSVVARRWASAESSRLYVDAHDIDSGQRLLQRVAVSHAETVIDAPPATSASAQAIGLAIASTHGGLILDGVDLLDRDALRDVTRRWHQLGVGPLCLVARAAPEDADVVLRLRPLCTAGEGTSEAARLYGLIRARAHADLDDDPAEDVEALVRELGGLPLAIAHAARRAHIHGPKDLLDAFATSTQIVGDDPWEPVFRSVGSEVHDALCSLARVRVPLNIHEFATLVSPGSDHVSIVASIERGVDAGLLITHRGGGRVRFALAPAYRRWLAQQVVEHQDERARRYRFVCEHADTLASRQGYAEDVVAAFHDAVSDGDMDIAKQLLARVEPLLPVLPAQTAEQIGRAWIAALGPDTHPAERVEALSMTANALQSQTKLDESASMLAQAIATPGDDTRTQRARARALVVYAFYEKLRGRIDDAMRHGRAALQIADELDDAPIRVRAHALISGIHIERCEISDAQSSVENQLRASRMASQPVMEASTRALQASVLRDQGRLDEAETCMREAIALAQTHAAHTHAAIMRGHLAGLLHEAGQLEEAAEHYEAALDYVSARGIGRSALLFGGGLASVLAERRDTGRADKALRRARVLAEAFGSPSLHLTLSVHQCIVELAHVAARRAHGDVEDAQDLLQIVRERRAALTAQDGGTPALSEDARYALRCLDRALTAHGPGPPSTELRVCHRIRGFQVAGEAWVDIARRPVLRRVLEVLVGAHSRAPGRWIGADELFDEAWPDENILAESARRRVRTQIWALRKLGLGDMIESDAGYRLRPTTTLVASRRA